jgi:hypothetical protein
MKTRPFVPPPADRPRQPIPAGIKTEHTETDGTVISTETLGTEVMEGLTVEGNRSTWTTPVGAVGNDKPIVKTEETWRSPELLVFVLDKKYDPQHGEEIIRLTNIVRGEPDPALFHPPADYTIVDDDGSAKITYTIPRL